MGVLVAEVEQGTLVYKEDADYALLTGATQTIKSLLDKLCSSRIEPVLQLAEISETQPEEGSWEPWDHHIFQDFESNFWLTLAEHPFLVGNEVPDCH